MQRPETFGRFRVRADLGASRFGPVYLGKDPSSGARVAIRTFEPSLWSGAAELDELLDSFRRLCAVKLDHPRLARPFAHGAEGNLAYLVYSYLPGTPMDVVSRQDGTRPAEEVLRRMTDVAAAVDAAAKSGVYHGMMAPCDLIFEQDATGLAGIGIVQALLRVGVSVEAHAPYASPQRIAGAPATGPDDIYSLAALTLELLIGKASESSSEASRAQRQAQGLPERRRAPRPEPHETRLFTTIPGIDAGRLRAAFAAALADEAAERQATCAEFVAGFREAFSQRDEPEEMTQASSAVVNVFVSEKRETKTLEPRALEPRAVEPRAVEPRAIEPKAVELKAVEPKPVEPKTVEPKAIETKAVETKPAEAKPIEKKESERKEKVEPPPVITVVRRAPVTEKAAPLEVPLRREPAPVRDFEIRQPPREPELRPAPERTFAPALTPPEPVHALHSTLPHIHHDVASKRGGWLVLALGIVAGVIIGFTGGYAMGQRSLQLAIAPNAAEESRATGTSASGAAQNAPQPVPDPEVKTEGSSTPPPPPVPAPAPELGRLLVRSTPSGAGVTIDGVTRGVTPLAIRDLELGEHTLEVAAPGHDTRQQRITLTAGRPSRSLDLTLRSNRPVRNQVSPTVTSSAVSGSLQVASRPAGGQVFLDDNLVGTAPLLLPNVSIGPHRVRIELPGFAPWAGVVTIEPGARFRINANLDR